MSGQQVIIPPFVVGEGRRGVFIWKHDAVFEYMRYLKDGWSDRQAGQWRR